MARSALRYPVNIKIQSADRLRLGVGYLVEQFTDPGLVSQPLLEVMESLAEIASAEAVATSGSRGVAREIMSEVEPFLARVKIPLAYGPTLNKGRTPGAKMPSTKELEAWAAQNGFSGNLFALARAIQKRGTKGRFFMRKARAAVRRAMPGAVDRMSALIEQRFKSRT